MKTRIVHYCSCGFEIAWHGAWASHQRAHPDHLELTRREYDALMAAPAAPPFPTVEELRQMMSDADWVIAHGDEPMEVSATLIWTLAKAALAALEAGAGQEEAR